MAIDEGTRQPDPAGSWEAGDGLGEDFVWALVESAPDGILIADESGHIVLVNHRAEEMFGYDRSELLGKAVEELLPDEMRRTHRAHRTRYRAEPRTRPMGAGLALRGRRADGTTFPVEISLSPLRARGAIRVIASIRDITDRIVADAQAREVHDVLDGIEDAVFMFDRTSLRFTYVNQGAVAQVGYPAAELLTMTPLHIAPELTVEDLGKVLARLEAGELRSHTLTTVHRRKDGEDVPVEVILQAPPPGPEGHRPPFVALVRDVRARIETESRLLDAERQLATLEDRERIARDLHDTVIQRLFAVGMSLQGTVAHVHDPVIADRMSQAVDDLDQTIREVRGAIFALETGHGLGGSRIRGDVLTVVAEQERGLGITPRVRFEGSVESIRHDAAVHVVPVLREMLSNVARHAGAGAVRVEIEAGDQIVIRVVDDGAGVADEGHRGNGLRNLSSRAEALGGAFSLVPGSAGGTVAEWRVPA